MIFRCPQPRPMAAGRGLHLMGLGLLWLALAGFAPGRVAAAPARAGSASLVFSEIYAPLDSRAAGQWFELHNLQPAFAYPLSGLVLASGSRRTTLQTNVSIPGGGYVLFVFTPDAVTQGAVHPLAGAAVVPVPDLGGLNPAADALILYTPDGGLVIDQVNWGAPDPTWPNYRPDLWNPGLPPLPASSDGVMRTWGRTPADRDTDLPRPPAGDWTIHELATPGGSIAPARPTAFLGDWTNLAGAAGSLLLWAAFVLIALIAHGFERRYQARSAWQLLLLAPAGLLFYSAVVILGFGQPRAALTPGQQWLAFPVLAVSALFCLVAMGLFRNAARTLPEGD